jgi:Bax protein
MLGDILKYLVFATILSSCAPGFRAGLMTGLPGTSANPAENQRPPTPLGPVDNGHPHDTKDTSHHPVLPSAGNSQNDFCDKIRLKSPRFNFDLSALQDSKEKLAMTLTSAHRPDPETQNQFICRLLPIALRLNKEIFRQRLEVQRLRAKSNAGQIALPSEKLWLNELAKAYGLQRGQGAQELLARVDVIPLTLLLVQAALESNWGTSLAARQDNNFFGMHGLMKDPTCRRVTDKVCLRSFASPELGVGAYMAYMNTSIGGTSQFLVHFRSARALMRSSSQDLDAIKLARTLTAYSQLGASAYVARLGATIHAEPQIAAYEFNEQHEISEYKSGDGGVESPVLP